jgi:hypothetical protein
MTRDEGKDDEWRTWSNVLLGDLCGVSDWLVGDVRQKLENQVRDSRTCGDDEKRRGRDGKPQAARKAAPVNRISGGTTFDVVEIESAPGRKPVANGASVIDRRVVESVYKHLSTLVRAFSDLDL